MQLKKWVTSMGGPTQVAAKLGVTSSCVQLWIMGRSSPNAEHMIAMVKLSKGKLGFSDILKVRKWPRKEKTL